MIKHERVYLNIANKMGTKASKTTLKRYCLDIWSKLIKHRDNNTCFLCGSTTRLQAHHLITKKWLPTCCMLDNGITLCVGCHFMRLISAHHTPWVLEEQLRLKRPHQYAIFVMERNNIQARSKHVIDWQSTFDRLLKEYETNIGYTVIRNKRIVTTPQLEERVCNYYVQHTDMPLSDICKKTHVSHSRLKAILLRNNISLTEFHNRCMANFKERMRLSHGTKLQQLDLNNNVIREYTSYKEATEATGLHSTTSIRNVIYGKSKTSAGYKWRLTTNTGTTYATRN